MKNDAIQTRSSTAARTVKAVGNLNFRAGSAGGASSWSTPAPASAIGPSIRARRGRMPLAWRNHLGDSACSGIRRRILTIVTCRRQTIRIAPSSPRRTSRRSSSSSSSPESPTVPGIRRLTSRSASARWRAFSGSKQPRSLRRRRCSSCRSARCRVSAITPCACGRRRSTSMRSRGSRSSRKTSPRIASRLVPRSSGSRRSTPNRCDGGGTSSSAHMPSRVAR